MRASETRPPVTAAIRTDLGAIFVSLELSRSKWLITSLSPGAGEKLSRREVLASDVGALLAVFSELKAKAKAKAGMGRDYPIVAIQEAGLDGFWLDRVLMGEGIESHVVDPASIAVPRRKRRAKTDRIDGEMLIRALLAHKRGEPRVCAMVRPPTPEQEDRRRVSRERRTLMTERVEHTNRIKGLLFAQGVVDYEPLLKTRRARLEAVTTGDGRPLPEHIKQQIARELDRLELVMAQIKAVESERDALLADAAQAAARSPAACLRRLKGVAEEFAGVLWLEGLYKSFDNRRQLAAYAGLAPSPWKSGKIDHEQGVSKAGNPRLRSTMIQLSWLWLRHQPDTALTHWFQARVRQDRGRVRKVMIVALARKLLVALWKYVTTGLVPEGALLKPA